MYMPGSHIPIKPPSVLSENKPEYVVIFPWNLADEIKNDINSFLLNEFDNLEEPKKERFRKAVEAGTVELPIIARYSDGYLELVAGNTRLTGMMNEFGEGKAWIFDVPDEVAVLGESYDDVGQKIYKGNTTRVVNTPVADKNISVADKRIAKFSQQRDMDDMTYKGAKITMPGTNQAIAKAKSNINRAYSKQDKIDQRQGAGQSYITKGKPIKFPSSDNVSGLERFRPLLLGCILAHSTHAYTVSPGCDGVYF